MPTLELPRSFRGPGPATRLRASRWWWVTAAAAVVGLVLLMSYVSLSAIAPRTPWDENGILELARVFAGQSDVTPMFTRGYYPLASFLVTPVYWFTSDARTVYEWANLITNVVGVLTLLPLVGILRRVGLDRPQAITVGATTLMLPAYTALADYVLAEQVVGFLLVLIVYTAIRWWESPGWGRAAQFGGTVVAGMLAHPRMLVAVLVATVWLGGLLLSRTHRRTAAVTLIVMLPAAYAVKKLSEYLASLVLINGFSQGAALGDAISNPDPVLLIKVIFSQTWAQLLGSLGLVAFGVVVVTVWAGREVIGGRRFGPGVFIFGLTAAGCLLSFVNWSSIQYHFYGTEPRLDSWLYTRYIAPFVIVAIALGLAALLTRLSWPVALTALAGSAVIVAGMLLVFADTIPTWGSTYGPANVGALRAWERIWPTEPHAIPLTPTLTGPNRFWVLGSLAFLAAQAVVIVLARVPRVLGGALLGGVAYYAYLSNPSLEREYPIHLESGVTRIEAVTGETLDMDFERECGDDPIGRSTAINWVGFWFAPREIDVVRPSLGQEFDSDVVIACDVWDLADDHGAIPVPGSSDYGYQLWVLEGELQDTLAAAGVIERD